MSLEKPSSAEDEYFLREEAARKKREAIEKVHHIQKTERTQLRNLHYMKCPKYGFDLQPTHLHGVSVDQCYHCGGMWLDENELEQIARHREPNLFQRIAQVFQHKEKNP